MKHIMLVVRLSIMTKYVIVSQVLYQVKFSNFATVKALFIPNLSAQNIFVYHELSRTFASLGSICFIGIINILETITKVLNLNLVA